MNNNLLLPILLVIPVCLVAGPMTKEELHARKQQLEQERDAVLKELRNLREETMQYRRRAEDKRRQIEAAEKQH